MQNIQITHFMELRCAQTATQTATLDALDCGFISYEKNASNFKLKCFYCVESFPIRNWKTFIGHIEKHHKFVVEIFTNNENNENVLADPEEFSINTEEDVQEMEHNYKTEEEILKEKLVMESLEEAMVIAKNVSKMHSLNEPHFTVNEILSSTHKGQKFLQKSNLDEKDRKFLSHEISNYYLNRNTKISLKLFHLLTEEIISMFPGECKDTYINQDKNGQPRGKFYDTYRYKTKRYKTELSSCNSKQDQEKYFSVRDILLSTNEGQVFLMEIENSNFCFDEKDRKFFIREVVNYYLTHEIKLSVKLLYLLVEEIVTMFPSECRDTYFYQDKNGQGRGKLYDTYRYMAKKLRMNKQNNEKEVFTVKDILSSSMLGQVFLMDNNKNSCLDVKNRKFLINEIANFYVLHKTKLTLRICDTLTAEIVTLFPAESKYTYSYQDSKGKSRNRIRDAYNYQSRVIKINQQEFISENDNLLSAPESLINEIDYENEVADPIAIEDQNIETYTHEDLQIKQEMMEEEEEEEEFIDINKEIVEINQDYLEVEQKFILDVPNIELNAENIENNADLHSAPKIHSVTEQYFTVKNILSTSRKGQLLLKKCDLKSLLDEKYRKYLIREIVNYYITHKMKLTLNLCELLVAEIVKMFPAECKNYYYYLDEEGQPNGKLYCTYLVMAQLRGYEISNQKDYFSVKDILSSTTIGQVFLMKIQNANFCFDEKDRKFFIHEIVNYYLTHKIKFSTKVLYLLVDEIVAMFPSECRDTYFYQDRSGQRRGKLYDTYRYKVRESRKKAQNNQEQYFTVKQILLSTNHGRVFLQTYNSKPNFDSKDRKFIINEIANYYVMRKVQITLSICNLLISEIVSIFHTESKDSYSIKDTKGKTRSKICAAYVYYKRKQAKLNKTIKRQQYFKVKDILLSTTKGQSFLQYSNSKSALDENDRKFLIQEIVNYYLTHKSNLTEKFGRLLVTDIISIFPKESEDSYYYRGSKGKLFAKMVSAFRRKKMRLSKAKKST